MLAPRYRLRACGLVTKPLLVLMLRQQGRTALMRAARGGHAECTRVLIEAGANIHAADEVRVIYRSLWLCMPSVSCVTGSFHQLYDNEFIVSSFMKNYACPFHGLM